MKFTTHDAASPRTSFHDRDTRKSSSRARLSVFTVDFRAIAALDLWFPGLRNRQILHPQLPWLLALDAERLSAGRQDLQTRSSPQHPESQSSGGLDDMLAVVEHQEHPFVAQKRKQAGGPILRGNVEADRRTNCRVQLPWIADGGQIDKPNPVLVAVDQPLSSRNGNGGLTDTTRPDNRDQAVMRQLRRNSADNLIAVD